MNRSDFKTLAFHLANCLQNRQEGRCKTNGCNNCSVTDMRIFEGLTPIELTQIRDEAEAILKYSKVRAEHEEKRLKKIKKAWTVFWITVVIGVFLIARAWIIALT
ncbi:MAG: hypothetical protein MJ185_02615 [Treponema sp.]|nr:hypothetical protein [Treponema sp.]